MQNKNRSLDDFEKIIYTSMRKINDTKELNEIYSQINNFIQQYIESHNILPSEIYRYVKKNMNRFLEKNNLKDIDRIDQIVEDVIRHRLGMERDQIVTFSKYSEKLNESLLQTDLSSVEHEKILADFYNSSLGHVKTIDSQMHLFEIEDFGESKKCIIFSDDEMSRITKNLIEQIFDDLKKSSVKLESLNGLSINTCLDFSLGSILSEFDTKEYITTKLDKDTLLLIITNLIPTSYVGKEMVGLPKFIENFKGYYIWEI